MVFFERRWKVYTITCERKKYQSVKREVEEKAGRKGKE